MGKEAPRVAVLSGGGVDVVAYIYEHEGPAIAYWGPSLGLGVHEAGALPTAGYRSIPLVPLCCHREWNEEPGLDGSYEGDLFSPLFDSFEVSVGPSSLCFSSVDVSGSLELTGELAVEPSGLVKARAQVTNLSERVYGVRAMSVCLPLPFGEDDVYEQVGGWGIEHQERRHPLSQGIHARRVRNCRGVDSSPVHGVCAHGADWARGGVHLIHVAWSGNTRTQVEMTSMCERFARGGEYLFDGEVRLARGESYRMPWVYGTCGEGLDEAAARFHAHVRALPSHPVTDRPVTINTWEAVGFRMSEEKLTELADVAAGVGVERFVVDDGWFSTRRYDDSGLGDWWVSEEVWPEGIDRLIAHVHGLGMQFGIWFEPECANTDSEVARAHPEWILSPLDHRPAEQRNQQGLNLAIPECLDYVYGQMERFLSEHEVDYIKWDNNRDLWEAGDQRTGRPGYRAETLAYYELLDRLRRRFPALEIESCASGGGRIDLEVMERAQRVWGSDMLDPVERWAIHDGTDMLLPPEVVGAHIGKPWCRFTGRTSSLQFRAAGSFLYHLGIEWDLTCATGEELSELAAWVAAYKQWCPMLRRARVVHACGERGYLRLRGAVSPDKSSAVFVAYSPTTYPIDDCERGFLPGLDPEALYEVRALPGAPQATPAAVRFTQVPWWDADEPLVLTGRALATLGLQLPKINPEQALVFTCTAR